MSQPKITPEVARQRYLTQTIQNKIDWVVEQIDLQTTKSLHEPTFRIPKDKAQPEVIQGLKDLRWRVERMEHDNPAFEDYYYVTWQA